MNVAHLRPNVRILTLLGVAVLAVAGLTWNGARAQTRTADAGPSVTPDQQKQLDHLRQLNDQLQKDRDAVDVAAARYGWDSNEADAAQQRLFQDRQECRSLRQSLQAGGVSIPADPKSGGTRNQTAQNDPCCSHGHGHHGCCDGRHNCDGNSSDCGHHGEHCYHGHHD